MNLPPQITDILKEKLVMSKDISQVDKNLAVAAEINAPDCIFQSVKETPFELYGLYNAKGEDVFRRLPEDVARATSEGVTTLHTHTAGGRVRFSTDSEYVAIRASVPSVTHFAHMPLTGVAGFDMYVSRDGHDIFAKTFVPPYGMTDGYASIHHFGDKKMREITINFPLYNPVNELYVGIQDGAALSHGHKYKHETPVVYYGSSITQGGCASRPGNAYPALISQALDCDYINLGFSGNAKGEDAMMDYIASLSMSAFVYDYDHNAPNVAHLKNTHERGFLKIREKHPSLPVIFVSAPNDDAKSIQLREQRSVILETYLNALKNGDENVYFVDGSSLFDGEFANSCTVDGCHPTDLGFLRMARGIGRAVARALGE